MKNRLNGRTLATVLCLVVLAITVPGCVWAQAATSCPAFTPPSGANLLLNPGLETVGPCGPFTVWAAGNGNCGVNSAALNWTIHSSNQQTQVITRLVNSTDPIGGQAKMLHITAKGNESGIFQLMPTGLTTVMVTAWVYVRSGHVVLQASGGNTGPSSWNSVKNQWEQLRVCTDGTVPADSTWVVNEDPAGGDFFVDNISAYSVVQPAR